ncbi:MAG: AMP-binding protein [Congregibacter sp.]
MVDARSNNPTLLKDLRHWAAERPNTPWMIEAWSNHERSFTWAEGAAEIQAAAAWLATKTSQPGAKVGLLSANCAHWMLADYAIMASGNVTVPIFTTMNAETVDYVASFAGIEMLVLGNAANWEAIRSVIPEHIHIVTLPSAPVVDGATSWDQIVAEGKQLPSPEDADENKLATIVFTSGTTGKPKGVMHSMATLREASDGVRLLTQSNTDSRWLSYLPLAHMAERVVVENHAMVAGGTIYFNESQESFLKDLQNAKPTMLLGVPRIWEKLQQVVLAHLVSLEDLNEARANGEVDAVAAKVKGFLGLESIEYILTSTAPTPAPLKAWYEELGIVLYDGYGQSEVLPVCGNRPDNRKLDSIGVAVPGVDIRIAEDGEIMARGSGTSLGYYNDPEKTAETFEPDGWVHTGDRGRIDEDGHVFITGRVKEIFKTARGKYVAPAPIEGQFLESPSIEQACLTGLGLTQTVMIAVVAESASTKSDDELSSELLSWTASINARLEKHERIGALLLTPTPWTQENEVLTHTLKLKRDAVEDRYASALAESGERMRNNESLFVMPVE